MSAISLTALLVASMLPSLFLRCSPFLSLTTPAQRRTLLRWHGVALLGSSLFLYSVIRFQLFPLSRISYLCSLFSVATTLINILVIRGHTREHLFTFGIVLDLGYLLLILPAVVITQTVGLETPEGCALASLLYLVLLLLLYPLIRKLLDHTVMPFLTLDSGDYWNTIWFIPLALYGAVLLTTHQANYTFTVSQLFSSALLASMLVLMSLSISAYHKRLTERQQLTDQLRAQELHYGQLQTKMQEARRHKHDFQHHITAIRQMAAAEDHAAILEYCDDLVARSRLYDHIPYSGNAAVDGVLYRYIELARENQTELQYSGAIRSQGIKDIDLCVLLGNALENALTGCLTVQENRSIRLVAQSEAQTLSLLVHNTFDGVVVQRGDDILSRKRDGRTGVGLASMRSVCEKLGGTLEITWDETHFTVLMILPLSQT